MIPVHFGYWEATCTRNLVNLHGLSGSLNPNVYSVVNLDHLLRWCFERNFLVLHGLSGSQNAYVDSVINLDRHLKGCVERVYVEVWCWPNFRSPLLEVVFWQHLYCTHFSSHSVSTPFNAALLQTHPQASNFFYPGPWSWSFRAFCSILSLYPGCKVQLEKLFSHRHLRVVSSTIANCTTFITFNSTATGNHAVS